ncbi:5'-nucleotidase C-terminal domain-containing protein [Neolewinella antarctica]|uniref:2',3'-cyclic-nucleotide 2'-phosphodiesterase (5'-nucleotidase family) n=1 Tax=Neolewinella antarctica TaxID=442734 RepID=A0ABX0X7Q9_9BACT|nr:5'-nucleotidase [Neolewinella antarctica]NJC25192.1 2',3'-cyclic-nucleotide 2'-phosphodiesterase (5'-nucleotidase family) [Neolewinella antarctica]
MCKFLLPIIAVFSFVGCKASLGPVTVAPQLYEIDGAQSPRLSAGLASASRVRGTLEESGADEVAAMIDPYKDQLTAKMNRVLAQVATPLKKGAPESNLGNWMADIMYAAAQEYYPGKQIAFAVTNIGGLRVGEIGTGPLLVSEVYELMPFDNELVLLELNGAEVEEFLNHVANAGGWPVSEQLAVRRTGGKLGVTVNGQSLNPEEIYYVATIDYVADGGSDAAMLKGKIQLPSGQFLREVLVDFAGRSVGPIDVRSTGDRMRL